MTTWIVGDTGVFWRPRPKIFLGWGRPPLGFRDRMEAVLAPKIQNWRIASLLQVLRFCFDPGSLEMLCEGHFSVIAILPSAKFVSTSTFFVLWCRVRGHTRCCVSAEARRADETRAGASDLRPPF